MHTVYNECYASTDLWMHSLIDMIIYALHACDNDVNNL